MDITQNGLSTDIDQLTKRSVETLNHLPSRKNVPRFFCMVLDVVAPEIRLSSFLGLLFWMLSSVSVVVIFANISITLGRDIRFFCC